MPETHTPGCTTDHDPCIGCTSPTTIIDGLDTWWAANEDGTKTAYWDAAVRDLPRVLPRQTRDAWRRRLDELDAARCI